MEGKDETPGEHNSLDSSNNSKRIHIYFMLLHFVALCELYDNTL